MSAAKTTRRRRPGGSRPWRVVASLAIAALAAIARSEDPPAAPRPVREIRVRLACDEEWRAQPGWEVLARVRVLAASRAFESRFAVRWKVVDVVEWKSDDDAPTLNALLDQLERDVPRDGVDIALGLTCQSRARGAARGYRFAGLARYFGPAVLVCDAGPELRPGWNVGALVHELGHVLGAWHSEDLGSVMCASRDRTTSDAFDGQAAAVIDLCRDVDFRRGVDWLDDARRRRMAEIFREGHAPDERLTFVDVELERAARLLAQHDAAAARDLLRRALAEQAQCVSPDDPSLAICLRSLAAADLVGPGGDVGEAESLGRLALAIVTANGVAEDPPGASESVMAEIAWERGRFDEAAVRFRLVYEARLEALGAADPYTVAAKAALDRCGAPLAAARPWKEIERRLAQTGPAAGAAFDAPAPGIVHVRPLPRSVLFDGTARADWASETFELTTAEPGELAVELRESGPAQRAPSVRSVRRHVEATDAARTIRVRFSFGTPGPKEGEDEARYACELCIEVPREERPGSSGSFACDVPWRVAARVTRVTDFGAAGFGSVAARTSTTLRVWQWAGDAGAAVVAPADGHDVVVGGTECTADGAGAKRTWRLELTFTPDAAK